MWCGMTWSNIFNISLLFLQINIPYSKILDLDRYTYLWQLLSKYYIHDDVIQWKHLPHYWPFVWDSPVTGESPSQMPVTRNFHVSLICTRTSAWVNNRDAGDFWCHRYHCDVTLVHWFYRLNISTMNYWFIKKMFQHDNLLSGVNKVYCKHICGRIY